MYVYAILFTNIIGIFSCIKECVKLMHSAQVC